MVSENTLVVKATTVFDLGQDEDVTDYSDGDTSILAKVVSSSERK